MRTYDDSNEDGGTCSSNVAVLTISGCQEQVICASCLKVKGPVHLNIGYTIKGGHSEIFTVCT